MDTKPFEFVCYLMETDGEKALLLTESPQLVLARDADHAKTLAVSEMTKKSLVSESTLDRLEVAVRPFRR